MRDASPEDMAAFFIAKLLDQATWAHNKDIYLALIRIAAQRLIEECACTVNDPVSELRSLLEDISNTLPKPGESPQVTSSNETWMIPTFVRLLKEHPDLVSERQTFYWNTIHWKKDFLEALETQFWAYRHYAPSADTGKMKFLREFAEVWIAAATTALVRYSREDRSSWRWASQLLRRHARLVDDDGLRSLPWGVLKQMDEDS